MSRITVRISWVSRITTETNSGIQIGGYDEKKRGADFMGVQDYHVFP